MITPVKAALVEMGDFSDEDCDSIGYSDALVLDGKAKDVFLKIEGSLSLHNAKVIAQFLQDLIEAMKQTGLKRGDP